MIVLRLFAGAREAAGTARDEFEAGTVGDLLDAAVHRYGETFSRILGTCKIWLNGDECDRSDALGTGDEVAVLPPVSGGCCDPRSRPGARGSRSSLVP